MGTSGILLSLLLFSSIFAQYKVIAGSIRPLSTSLQESEKFDYNDYATRNNDELYGKQYETSNSPSDGIPQPTSTSEQEVKPVFDDVHHIYFTDEEIADSKNLGRPTITAFSGENGVSTREGISTIEAPLSSSPKSISSSETTGTSAASSPIMSHLTSGTHLIQDKENTAHGTREYEGTKPATTSEYYMTGHRDRNTGTDDKNSYNQDYRRDQYYRYDRNSGNRVRNTDGTWRYREYNRRTSGDDPSRGYYNNYGSEIRDVDFNRPGGMFVPPERDVNSHLFETGDQGVRYGSNDRPSRNWYYRRNSDDYGGRNRRLDNRYQADDYDRIYSQWRKELEEQSKRLENSYYGRDSPDVGYNTGNYGNQRHGDYSRSNYNYDNRRDYGADTNGNQRRHYVRTDGNRGTSDRHARTDWNNGPSQRQSESSYNDRNTLERNREQGRDLGSRDANYQQYNYESTDKPYIGTQHEVSREQYEGSTTDSGKHPVDETGKEYEEQEHNANIYGNRYQEGTDEGDGWYIYYDDGYGPDKWQNHNGSYDMMEYQNSDHGEYEDSDKGRYADWIEYQRTNDEFDTDRSRGWWLDGSDYRGSERYGSDHDRSKYREGDQEPVRDGTGQSRWWINDKSYEKSEHEHLDHETREKSNSEKSGDKFDEEHGNDHDSAKPELKSENEKGELEDTKSKDNSKISENHEHNSRYDFREVRERPRSKPWRAFGNRDSYVWGKDDHLNEYGREWKERGAGKQYLEHGSNSVPWWYDYVDYGDSTVQVPMYGKEYEHSMPYERGIGNPNDRYLYLFYRPKESSSYYKIREESVHKSPDIKDGVFPEGSKYGQHGKGIGENYPESAVTHYWPAKGTKGAPSKIEEHWVATERHAEGKRSTIIPSYLLDNRGGRNLVYYDGEWRYDSSYEPRDTEYSNYEEDNYSQKESSSESKPSSGYLSNRKLNDDISQEKVEAKVDAVESVASSELKETKEEFKITSPTYDDHTTHQIETMESEHMSEENSVKEEISKHDTKSGEKTHRSQESAESVKPKIIESEEQATATSEYEYNSKHASGSEEHKYTSIENRSGRHASIQWEEQEKIEHESKENEILTDTRISEAETETSKIEKLEEKLGSNEKSKEQVFDNQKSIEKGILQDEALSEHVMTSESKSDVEALNVSEQSSIHESEYKEEQVTAEEIVAAEHMNQEEELIGRIHSLENESDSGVDITDISEKSSINESRREEEQANLEEFEIAEHRNQEEELIERVLSTEYEPKSEVEIMNTADESLMQKSKHQQEQVSVEEIEAAEHMNQEEEIIGRIHSSENESDSGAEITNISEKSSIPENEYEEEPVHMEEFEIAEHQNQQDDTIERILSSEDEPESAVPIINIADQSLTHESEYEEEHMNLEEVGIDEHMNHEEELLGRVVSTEDETKSDVEIVNIAHESASHESEHKETQMDPEKMEMLEHQNQQEEMHKRMLSAEDEPESEVQIINIAHESSSHESENEEKQVNVDEMKITEHRNQEEELIGNILLMENESDSDAGITNILEKSSVRKRAHEEEQVNVEAIEIAEHQNHEQELFERIHSTEDESEQASLEEIGIEEHMNQEEELLERNLSMEDEPKSEVQIVDIADESSIHESKYNEEQLSVEEIEVAEHMSQDDELIRHIHSSENESDSDVDIVNIAHESSSHEGKHEEEQFHVEKMDIAEYQNQEEELLERNLLTEDEPKSEVQIVNIADESLIHENKHKEKQVSVEEIDVVQHMHQDEELVERIHSSENVSDSDVEIVNTAHESSSHESKHEEEQFHVEEMEIAEHQNQEKEFIGRVASTEDEPKSEVQIVDIPDENSLHESKYEEEQVSVEEIDVAYHMHQDEELIGRIHSSENQSDSDVEIVNIAHERSSHESTNEEEQVNVEEMEIAEYQSQEEELLERSISTEDEPKSEVQILNIADESLIHESKYEEEQVSVEEIVAAEHTHQDEELIGRVLSTENEPKSEVQIVNIPDESSIQESKYNEEQVNVEEMEIAEHMNQEEELIGRVHSSENESDSDVEIVNIAHESSSHESTNEEEQFHVEEMDIAEHQNHEQELFERIHSTEEESKQASLEEIGIEEHMNQEEELLERNLFTEDEPKSEVQIVNIADDSFIHENKHKEGQMSVEEIVPSKQMSQEEELVERIHSSENESDSDAEITNILEKSLIPESEYEEEQVSEKEIEAAEHMNQEEELIRRVHSSENESDSDVEIVNIAHESSSHESKQEEEQFHVEEMDIAEYQNQEEKLRERNFSTEDEPKSEVQIVNIPDENSIHESKYNEEQLSVEELEIAEYRNQEKELLERNFSPEDEPKSAVQIVNIPDESSIHKRAHEENQVYVEEIDIAEQMKQEEELIERVLSIEDEPESASQIVNVADESLIHESEYKEEQVSAEEIVATEHLNQEEELIDRVLSIEDEPESASQIVNIANESSIHESEYKQEQVSAEEIVATEHMNQEEELIDRVLSIEDEPESASQIVNIADESSIHESEYKEEQVSVEEIVATEHMNQEEELIDRVLSTEDEPEFASQIVNIADESSIHESEYKEEQVSAEEIVATEHLNQEEELIDRVLSIEDEPESASQIVNIADESSIHESKYKEEQVSVEEIVATEHMNQEEELIDRVLSTEDEPESPSQIVNIADESSIHESEYKEEQVSAEEIVATEHMNQEEQLIDRVLSTEDEPESASQIVNVADESLIHESEYKEEQVRAEEIVAAEHMNQEEELIDRVPSIEDEPEFASQIVNIADESSIHESEYKEEQVSAEEIVATEHLNQEEELIDRVLSIEDEPESASQIVNIADESSIHESKYKEEQVSVEEIVATEHMNQEEELIGRMDSSENEPDSDVEITNISEKSSTHESEHAADQVSVEKIEVAKHMNQEEELIERVLSTESEPKSEVETVNIADESILHESKHKQEELSVEEIKVAEHMNQAEELIGRMDSSENEPDSDVEITNILEKSSIPENEHEEEQVHVEEFEIAEHQNQQEDIIERIVSSEDEPESAVPIMNIADKSLTYENEYKEEHMNLEEIEITKHTNDEEASLERILSTENVSDSDVEVINISEESSMHESEHKEEKMSVEEIEIAEHQSQEGETIGRILSVENEPDLEATSISMSESSINEIKEEKLLSQLDNSMVNTEDRITEQIIENQGLSSKSIESTNDQFRGQDAAELLDESETVSRGISDQELGITEIPWETTHQLPASVTDHNTKDEPTETQRKNIEIEHEANEASTPIESEIVENEQHEYTFNHNSGSTEKMHGRLGESLESLESVDSLQSLESPESLESLESFELRNHEHGNIDNHHSGQHKMQYYSKEHEMQHDKHPDNHHMMHHSIDRENPDLDDIRSKFVTYKMGQSKSRPQRVLTMRSWSTNGKKEPGRPLHHIVNHQKQFPLNFEKEEEYSKEQYHIHSKEHSLEYDRSKEHHHKDEEKVDFYRYRIGETDLEGEVTSAEQSAIINENKEGMQEVHQDGIIENRQRDEDLAELVIPTTDESESVRKVAETKPSANEVENMEHLEKLQNGASKEHEYFQDSSEFITLRTDESKSETRAETAEILNQSETKEHSETLEKNEIRDNDREYQSEFEEAQQNQKHSSESIVSTASESNSQIHSMETDVFGRINENEGNAQSLQEMEIIKNESKEKDFAELSESAISESKSEAQAAGTVQSWVENRSEELLYKSQNTESKEYEFELGEEVSDPITLKIDEPESETRPTETMQTPSYIESKERSEELQHGEIESKELPHEREVRETQQNQKHSSESIVSTASESNSQFHSMETDLFRRTNEIEENPQKLQEMEIIENESKEKDFSELSESAQTVQSWVENRSEELLYKSQNTESKEYELEHGEDVSDPITFKIDEPESETRTIETMQTPNYIESKERLEELQHGAIESKELQHEREVRETQQNQKHSSESIVPTVGEPNSQIDSMETDVFGRINENEENPQKLQKIEIIENETKENDLAELSESEFSESKSEAQEAGTVQSWIENRSEEHLYKSQNTESKEYELEHGEEVSDPITLKVDEPESEIRPTETMQTPSYIESKERSEELRHGKIESNELQHDREVREAQQNQEYSSESIASTVTESNSQAQPPRIENLENIRENRVMVEKPFEEDRKQRDQDLSAMITPSFDESKTEAGVAENKQSWNEHQETKERSPETQYSKEYEVQHQGGSTEYKLNHQSGSEDHNLNDLGDTDEDEAHRIKMLAELIAARLAASKTQTGEATKSLNIDKNTESNPRFMGTQSDKSSVFQKENSGIPETKIHNEVINEELDNVEVNDIKNDEDSLEDSFYESEILRSRRQDRPLYYTERRPEYNLDRSASKPLDGKITGLKSGNNRPIYAGNRNRLMKGDHNYESNRIGATSYQRPNVVSKNTVVVPNQNRWYIIRPQYYSVPHEPDDYNWYGRRQYGYRRYNRPPVPRRPYTRPYYQ